MLRGQQGFSSGKLLTQRLVTRLTRCRLNPTFPCIDLNPDDHQRHPPPIALLLAVRHPAVSQRAKPMMDMHGAQLQLRALLSQLHQLMQQYAGVEATAVGQQHGALRCKSMFKMGNGRHGAPDIKNPADGPGLTGHYFMPDTALTANHPDR